MTQARDQAHDAPRDAAHDPQRDAASDEARDAARGASSTARAERSARHAALLSEARAGRREALNAMVAELTPLLWHVARGQGVSPATAEDVVQTTWLSLLRELDDIRAPESLVAWLVTVARREAVRLRQRSRRDQSVAEFAADDHADPAANQEELVVSDERSRLLWGAINGLPDRCRTLLRLIAFVDRPDYDAVSTAMGMPRGSIGPTRGRCLAKLRAALTASPHWS